MLRILQTTKTITSFLLLRYPGLLKRSSRLLYIARIEFRQFRVTKVNCSERVRLLNFQRTKARERKKWKRLKARSRTFVSPEFEFSSVYLLLGVSYLRVSLSFNLGFRVSLEAL